MRPRWQRTARRETQSVDVTAFLSLMVILVPFLLVTAVFSRTTIIELQAAGLAESDPTGVDPLQLRVVVREEVIEVTYHDLEAPVFFSRSGDGSEVGSLAALAVRLKEQYPQSAQATVLLEPQIRYDFLVQVLDAVRVNMRDVEPGAAGEPLFPSIALGGLPAVLPGQDAGS
jgi:biopolymer transport protein ExbD